MHAIGMMIGHFEPLHLGHIRSILHASGQVKSLHLFITPHPSPNPNFHIDLKDKARWLTMAFADLPFITVHLLPNGESLTNTTTITHFNDALLPLLTEFFPDTLTGSPSPPILFLDDTHVLVQTANQVSAAHEPFYPKQADETLIVPVLTTPHQHEFDSAKIHANPALYWQAIHPQARADYTKTVTIVGGESSGKTTLLHKLVNYYGASYALEMGRVFVTTDLGGTELGMQYDDYPMMASDHEQAIRAAKAFAPAPITLVDTDFVTTQAFCDIYEGKTHPFLTSCIETFRMDHTLMLANNTPWVADGMRSLGSSTAREAFENKLKQIFAQHHITPVYIDSPDYHQRFLQAVAWIDHVIFHDYQDLV